MPILVHKDSTNTDVQRSSSFPLPHYIPPWWVNGRDAVLAVTVGNSIQQELVKREAAQVGSSAFRKHGVKMTKYFQDSDKGEFLVNKM